MNMITKWQNKYTEAGCDEVGRGCLAGPVVAASVILDEKFNNFLVKDSKTLSKTSIKELAEYIKIFMHAIMLLRNYLQNLLISIIS